MADRFSTETKIDEWILETDESKLAQPIAEVIRQEIAIAIRNLPGKKWDRSGTLVNGLRIERQPDGSWAVLPPADRLQTDDLMQRLIADVPMIADPMSSPRVIAAIEASLAIVVRAK